MAKGLALDLAPAGITVNVVAPGWFDSPLADGWKNNPELSAAITGHTAQRRWGPPPTWPAPTSSSPPTRRRSSPAPCSTSTAATCSYDAATEKRRVVAITGAGGALGAAISQQLAGEPATDLVLSDVSEPSLDATVAGLRDTTARSRRPSPT